MSSIKTWILLAVATVTFAGNPVTCDVSWVPSSPEVSTYRSASGAAGELYQLAIVKNGSTIETYIDIASPGFMKFISGSMTLGMVPLRSTGKILIGGQIQMNTDIQYGDNKLKVSTVMNPINQTLAAEVPWSGQIVDLAQTPFLLRMLPLSTGAQFDFSSLNPRTNKIAPIHVSVTGEETMLKIDSYRVDCTDFEGESVYWIEKAAPHRILRIEQPAQHRTLDLVM